MDEMYIRPFLIHKFNKKKKRFEFEFEDVLRENQVIEEELNQDSSDEDNTTSVYKQYKNLSHNVASDVLS